VCVEGKAVEDDVDEDGVVVEDCEVVEVVADCLVYE
jgi:hypothetical protein